MQLPFEVLLGDKRLEVYLRVEKVETDRGDDLDLELSLRAPDVLTAVTPDFVPKVYLLGDKAKIDIDGSAMNVTEDGIAEGPVDAAKDLVQSDVAEVLPAPLPFAEGMLTPGSAEELVEEVEDAAPSSGAKKKKR